MLSDAFEEAFYQLDEDRDGVITVRDLEKYAQMKNLKETFKKKWLSLFADEKNVIYYDNFCMTLGIVPAPEKFQNIIHKVDMTVETQKSIIDIIADLRLRNQDLSNDTLEKIKNQVTKDNGGVWDMKLNPDNNDLNVTYEEDGILHYSPSGSKTLNILIWKVPQALEIEFQNIIHKVDMTVETQKSVIDIVADLQLRDQDLSNDTLEKIKNQVAKDNGGVWDMKLNPNSNDLNVKYEKDGILHYSPSGSKTLNILIWRVPKALETEVACPVIYECDMSESVKIDVLKIVAQNIDAVKEEDFKPKIINEELNQKFGEIWNMELNPSKEKLKVDYDFDGKIYFSPNSKEDLKILIWRQSPQKKRGSLCCCGLF